jgi:hypothetical protein
MAPKNTQKTGSAPSRTQQARTPITLELVIRLAPSLVQAEKIATAFGLEAIDFDAIREGTEEHIGLSAQVLQPTVNDTALRIHLQRIVGAFVSSAHGAAEFYGNKVTQARDLTSKLANDDRDEDREAVYGSESKASRAREFAAQAGLTACALLAAATGAVHAYHAITGDEWKPYQPATPSGAVSRQAAAAELATFAA